jgi:hypothetical protein
MPDSRIENLLAVRWFDGLVVGSQHLAHSDRRVQRMLGEISQGALDQPGVLIDETPNRTPSQLIHLESSQTTPEGLRVTVTLTRPFVAVSPVGGLVIGYSSRGGQPGIPDRPLSATLPGLAGDGALLLAVRQVAADDLKIEQKANTGNQLDLTYPGLQSLVVTVEQYKERVVGEFADCVVIGSVKVTGGTPIIDQEYVPPVVKLAATSAFNDGILPKISAHWDALFQVVTEKVDAAGAAFAAGQVGADLMSRRTDYEALRTLLLCTRGLAKNVAGISPTRLLFEAVQPLATWWEYHRARHFPNVDLNNQQSPVAAVSRRAQSIAGMTHRDLWVGSSELLRQTNEFLPGVKDVLAVA